MGRDDQEDLNVMIKGQNLADSPLAMLKAKPANTNKRRSPQKLRFGHRPRVIRDPSEASRVSSCNAIITWTDSGI